MTTTRFVSTHSAFFSVAERMPDAPALKEQAGITTYAEVAVRARALAAQLASLGVRRGTIVPVLSAQPGEAIISMLGMWSIGAVPAPPDANALFEQNLQRLLTISPEWVLLGELPETTLSELSERYPIPGRVSIKDCIEAGGQIQPLEVVADDPAYITFTSGSTGVPKGIIGRHCGITHFVDWERELTGFAEGDRVSVITSTAFDAFLRDAFLPLTSGGVAVIPTTEERRDADALLHWIAREKIRITHMVPSLFAALVESAERTGIQLDSWDWSLLSGEILRPELARRWFALPGASARLVNLYGPSETTMTKLFHIVEEADTRKPAIPIGRAMPGVGVVLLNDSNRPVADGVVGEIVFRTPYMSLGYYNAPEETKQRFVVNPLGQDPTDIVYRTGDRGRRSPDGTFEFLGRSDRQVKRNGIRIELDEIEHVLTLAPGVAAAAVVDWSDERGSTQDNYLAAYLETEQSVDPAEVKEFLAARLPEPALPAVVMVLDSLPRTISGKLDRTSLPEPIATRSAEAVAPRTSTEEIVLGVMKGILPSSMDLGVTDNFFTVGGHSLLVMRLLSIINDEFGAQVQLGDFLKRPTAEHLAELVEDEVVRGLESDEDLLAELMTDPAGEGELHNV